MDGYLTMMRFEGMSRYKKSMPTPFMRINETVSQKLQKTFKDKSKTLVVLPQYRGKLVKSGLNDSQVKNMMKKSCTSTMLIHE